MYLKTMIAYFIRANLISLSKATIQNKVRMIEKKKLKLIYH
jgi:hypothetical protein